MRTGRDGMTRAEGWTMPDTPALPTSLPDLPAGPTGCPCRICAWARRNGTSPAALTYEAAVGEMERQVSESMARQEEAAIIGQDGVMRHRSRIFHAGRQSGLTLPRDTPFPQWFWGPHPLNAPVSSNYEGIQRTVYDTPLLGVPLDWFTLPEPCSARPVQGCLFDDLLDPKPGA